MRDLLSSPHHKDFQKYINEQEKKKNMTLESYLITPIQWIPRYELLLIQCQKYTNKRREDYDLLSKSITLVWEVNRLNNSSMST